MKIRTSDIFKMSRMATFAMVAAITTISPFRELLAEEQKGRVTNLPIPRYVSLKTQEANVRRGPALSHQVDWIFKGQGLPVKVTAEYGHWRRIEDRDGEGGWIHYALLSGNRRVIVDADLIDLHKKPDAGSPVAAHLKKSVIANLGECQNDWCQLSVGGHKGWARSEHLWGTEEKPTQ